MKRVCAWCDKIMRSEKCEPNNDKVTHGICSACKKNASREITLLKTSLLNRKISRCTKLL